MGQEITKKRNRRIVLGIALGAAAAIAIIGTGISGYYLGSKNKDNFGIEGYIEGKATGYAIGYNDAVKGREPLPGSHLRPIELDFDIYATQTDLQLMEIVKEQNDPDKIVWETETNPDGVTIWKATPKE